MTSADTMAVLNACAAKLHPLLENLRPKIAVTLGSGLGGFADAMHIKAAVSYADLPGLPCSTVEGHAGRFVFGCVDEVPVIAMQGRVHLYEGYTPRECVLPIRLLRMLGVETIILTNAAGGIQDGMQPGDLMLITDQIASFVPSPLQGENIDSLGVRFPDMSEVYSRRLQQTVRMQAQKLGIPLKEGIYLQNAGPAFETPAEIRMFRTLGADAVGMSTAIEAMAARHCGMEVCGISCISNLAAGISKQPLTHAEVKETADRVAPRFRTLLQGIISEAGQAPKA